MSRGDPREASWKHLELPFSEVVLWWEQYAKGLSTQAGDCLPFLAVGVSVKHLLL